MKTLLVIRGLRGVPRWPCILVSALWRARRYAPDMPIKGSLKRELSCVASLYLELCSRIGKRRALGIMKGIVIAIGIREFSSLRPAHSGMAGVEEFNNRVAHARWGNAGRYVSQDEDRIHLRIDHCVFEEFFRKTGIPELTPIFCEVDKEGFRRVLPEIRFHRNGSSRHTLAHGHPSCEFVFEHR